MCGFLVANFIIAANISAHVNSKIQRRGPDLTCRVVVKGVEFVHNLLHLTGPATLQPLLEPDQGGAAVFNGEVYNYAKLAQDLALPPGQSDGHVLLSAYRRWGSAFIRRLDAEIALAIIDFRNDKVILARDAFGTKPLWIARDSHSRWAIASYRSALSELGFDDPELIGPNVVLTCQLQDLGLCSQGRSWRFDLRQWKNSTQDWREAFQQAVAKRTSQGEGGPARGIFLGLSSGHDSGAIHVELLRQGQEHAAYSLLSSEEMDLINARVQYAQEVDGGGQWASAAVLEASHDQFYWEREWVASYAELYESFEYKAMSNPSFVGSSLICREAAARNYRVMLSGQGADETMTNYGNRGSPLKDAKGQTTFNASEAHFAGLYPSNLYEVFPWTNFFRGTNQDFLNTIEAACGAHGIEARYPFLDPRVVQEWLWLVPDAKNSAYKLPIEDLFNSSGYPFAPSIKVGFGAAHGLNSNRWHGRAWATNSRILRPFEDVLPPVFVTHALDGFRLHRVQAKDVCLNKEVPELYATVVTDMWRGAVILSQHILLESFLFCCCYRHGVSDDAKECATMIMSSRDTMGDTALQRAENDGNHEMAGILRKLACAMLTGRRRTAMLTLGEKDLERGERFKVAESVFESRNVRSEASFSPSDVANIRNERVLVSSKRVSQFCDDPSLEISLDGLDLERSIAVLMEYFDMVSEQLLGEAGHTEMDLVAVVRSILTS